MDDTWRSIGLILIIGLLLIVSFILVLFKTSLYRCNDSTLMDSLENDEKSKEYIFGAKSKISNLCQAGSIFIILIVTSIITLSWCSGFFEAFLFIFAKLKNLRADMLSIANYPILMYSAAIICFLISFYVTIILGYLLPKKVAVKDPEKNILKYMGFIKPVAVVLNIILFIPIRLAAVFAKILGVKAAQDNKDVTEEEIRMLVNAGNQYGTIELSEREMINNIFEFDDRTVDEVMTHRTDIYAVNKEDSINDVLKISINEGFSRIPVYDDDIDDIVGIIYAKDLLELVGENNVSDKKISDYMREVIYVPESTRCRMLFRQFKETKIHMAVIVDEYGGTAGIATMEDLLETIVGNIQDEYDSEEDEILDLGDGTYSLDGGLLITKAEELFDVELTDDDDDTDTIGGLVANTLGRIPNNHECPTVTICDVEFVVESVEDRRIIRIKARKLPKTILTEE